MWSRIERHVGEEFHVARGRPFTSTATERAIHVSTTNWGLNRTAIERALPLGRTRAGCGVWSTSSYFLMLVGVEGVKADTMVLGFVERTLGRSVTQGEAEELIESAAARLGRTRVALDHAIWRHESDRRRRRSKA